MSKKDDNAYCAKHYESPEGFVQWLCVKNGQVLQLALLTDTFPFLPLQALFYILLCNALLLGVF